jgi:tight adherence protein B
MHQDETLFLIMVFVAVTLLVWALAVPALGADAGATRRLRSRVTNVIESMDDESAGALLRENRLHGLTKLERSLEDLPALEDLAAIIEGSGRRTPAYRVILLCILLGAISAIIVWYLTAHVIATVLLSAAMIYFPIFKLKSDREKRLAKFEEQLPDALGMLSRSMRAGHPFTESLRLVAEDNAEPLATEFRNVYYSMNCGMSTRAAFMLMLQRMPSISLMNLVTAVLVQKDVGGNLAEIIDKIDAVIRSRFKLQRKIKTITAEARLSAWVLTLLPFIIAALMTITNPGYFDMMSKDPIGRKLIGVSFIMLILGVLWIRKVIKIRV